MQDLNGVDWFPLHPGIFLRRMLAFLCGVYIIEPFERYWGGHGVCLPGILVAEYVWSIVSRTMAHWQHIFSTKTTHSADILLARQRLCL